MICKQLKQPDVILQVVQLMELYGFKKDCLFYIL